MPILFFLALAIIVIFITMKFVKRNNTSLHNDTPTSTQAPLGSPYRIDTAENSQPPPNGIDSWNIPSSFSLKEREEFKKIAEYFGVRYITGEETRKWIIHNLCETFSSMPGWDIWDSSIHEAYGQFERAERGAMDKDISILCYDPKYKLAKVQGKTSVYLTSYKRCSCPDYRKRRLPCKHMYALAMELDGDVEKAIVDKNHAPLYGLTLALAGHLPKSSNGKGGIRVEITDRRGVWLERIEFDCSAVVMGTNPSQARQSRAEGFDMEILSPEMIEDIFTEHDKT